MARRVIFVHGTGVRGESWKATMDQVHAGLQRVDPEVALDGCFWGDTQGVKLHADGVSVPGYAEAGGAGPSEEEQELALWAVLYTDPWYELRLLADRKSEQSEELAPGQDSPARVLREQVSRYEPSGELGNRVGALGLDWGGSFEALKRSDEFEAASETASRDPHEHRRAVARAVVAHMVVTAEELGVPPIGGADRDELVRLIVNGLHGVGYGLEWLARPFKGMAARYATRRLRRRRGSVTDATAPAAGDILLYQARGDGIRGYIERTIAESQEPVVLLAHSLGGIACVDLLARKALPTVEKLVTVGSQAPYLYEIGALTSLEFGEPLPDHFPDWLNVYDERDFLSFVGAEVFPDRVRDFRVDNGQPFPQSHSAYWSNDKLWTEIGRALE